MDSSEKRYKRKPCLGKTACHILSLVVMLVWFSPEVMAAIKQNGTGGFEMSFSSSLSTIEFTGKATQCRLQLASLIKTECAVGDRDAVYTKWANNGLRVGDREDSYSVEYGPFHMKRNLATDELTLEEGGFNLALHVINTTFRQISKKKVESGQWQAGINTGLPSSYPQSIVFLGRAKPIRLRGVAEDTIIVEVSSKPFSFSPAEGVGTGGKITGNFKTVLVYSPSEDILYHNTSSFKAEYGGELLRIEKFQFLADESGQKPVAQLVNTDTFLDLKTEPIKIDNEGTLPAWSVQAIRAFDIANLTAAVVAKRTTNWPETLVSAGEEMGMNAAKENLRKWADKNAPDQVKRLLEEYDKYSNMTDKAAEQAVKEAIRKATEGTGLEYLNNRLSDALLGMLDVAKEPNPILKMQKFGDTIHDFYTGLAGDVLSEAERVAGELGSPGAAPPKYMGGAPSKFIAQQPPRTTVPEVDLTPEKSPTPKPPAVKKAPGPDIGDILIIGGGVGLGVGLIGVALSGMPDTSTGPNCGPAPTGWGNTWWREYQEWCYCMGGRPYNDSRGMGCDR